MPKLSVVIIAYNEVEKIEPAVKSVLWADEVVVVDSHSTDGTAALAEQLGARVVQVAFTGFGDLRNKALATATHEWVFSLDSDERCTPEARAEIETVIADTNAADAYFMPRRNFFMGRWIKHCGWYPDYRQPQLFKKAAMSYDNSAVHEKYHVNSDRPIGKLVHPIWQIPFKNLDELLHKANRYSTLGVARVSKKYKRPSMWRALSHATWMFIKIYILKMGFLDGWPGFVIAFGNFEGVFYRYAKHAEQYCEDFNGGY